MTTESNVTLPKSGPMTRAKLAKQLGISVPTLGRWIGRLKDSPMKREIKGKQQFTPKQATWLLKQFFYSESDVEQL